MKLFDYLMMFKNDVDFDVPDNEIDTVVTVCFDKENAEKISEDFPYMDKFTNLLLKKVDVDYLLSDGTPVCKFSDIINNNLKLFKNFVKNNWNEDMQWVLENIDNGEFAYEFIKDFHLVLAGYGNESSNKEYYELLEKCK